MVVELGTPRISDPTACVAWHSDTICQTHLATFESAVYVAWPNTSPPKGLCQCIELHFSFAVESVGRCWAGLTNIADIKISYVSPVSTTHDSCPLNWCCVTDWHHQCRNTIQILTIREHNDCRDPTIVCVKFCWRWIYASATGFAAERDRFIRWKGDIGFLCLCRLTAKESWKNSDAGLEHQTMMCLRLETMFC